MNAGAEITVRGGSGRIAPSPCGCPVGTVIEVRNLFFNTPVQTSVPENGADREGAHRRSLHATGAGESDMCTFVLTNNDKQLFDLPATTRWADRISAFFGAEIGEALIPINSDDAQIRISGYVCDPSVSRGNNRMQYLFLNGRHIRDRALQHALGEAYRGMLMVGRHPVCFLRMEMPAEMIDVNVHPTKLEVRFTDSGRVYSRLLQSLRHQFLTTNLTQRVGPAESSQDAASDLVEPVQPSALGLPANVEAQQRQAVIDWARTGEGPSPPNKQSMPNTQAVPGSGVPEFRPFPGGTSSIAPGTNQDGAAAVTASTTASPAEKAPWDGPDETAGNVDATAPSVCYLGFQVHNRYLVTQDDSGMVVIDQHALHERVLYERICVKVLSEESRLESQRLLVPEPVSLTPAERTAALDAKETLARIGMEIEDFGGETIVIQSYPAMLRQTPPGDMLRLLLESLMSAGRQPDPKDLLNHLLSTIACKAAVKAGDPLSPEEITSLLEQKDLYHDTHHCPHGRPTALFFSRDELDRMFGRLGPRGKA